MSAHEAEPVARRWLRLDAAYCALAGGTALALSGPVGRWFGVPAVLVAGVGAATVAWAWLLVRLARAAAWRAPLRLVAAANAAASAALAVLAAFAPGVGARLLLAAVTIEVAAFAAVQARTARVAQDRSR